MKPRTATQPDAPPSRAKPFPWRCPECGKQEVHAAQVAYTAEIKHDGRLCTVEIPDLSVPRCDACGELVFDTRADEQVARALRDQLGLLSAEQIRANRERIGLSQRQLADRLGVAVETISRWETGALTQSRAMDRYLRVYFGVPAVRIALEDRDVFSSLGVEVQK